MVHGDLVYVTTPILYCQGDPMHLVRMHVGETFICLDSDECSFTLLDPRKNKAIELLKVASSNFNMLVRLE